MATTPIIIGNLTLNGDNAPRVNIKFDYYKSDTNITIGGKKVITINGVVSVSDNGGLTAANVMTQLRQIRETGRTSKCVNVSIPDIYSGKARIENINIEQGADPTWVNQGAFSIILEAPLDIIPPNPYGIVASDYVKSLSFSEKIDVGEDAHGYVYTEDNNLSRAFVRFSCKVNVEVDPLCQTINNKTLLEKTLRKFIKNAPTHQLLNKYKQWRVFLQDRSYTVSNNSADFSSSCILLSPNSRGQAAYTELNFEHKATYDKLEETKIISGNIRGLVSIPWSDIISLNSFPSKLDSAESALSYIYNTYSDISAWKGQEYELTRYNCPPSADPSNNPCASQGAIEKNKDCLKPISSSVSKNRTEGSIDFSFEWVNTDCSRNSPNSITMEYQIEDVKSQPTTQEHIIPTVGILLQNLNCYTARKVSFTSILNFPDNARSCGGSLNCGQDDSLNEYIAKYWINKGLNPADFLMIEHTLSRTNRADTLRKSYISVCQTYLN